MSVYGRAFLAHKDDPVNECGYERQELEQERQQESEYATPTSEYQQRRQDRDHRIEDDLKKARIISHHFKDEF